MQITKEIYTKHLNNLLYEAHYFLAGDVLLALSNALKKETYDCARDVLQKILENANYASSVKLPLCQDTGIPQVFLEVGKDVNFNFELSLCTNEVIQNFYNNEKLRKSCIKDPLIRVENLHCSTIYVEHVDYFDKKARLSVLIRGGGSENMSATEIFLPTADLEEIKKFIVEKVISMLEYTCPPVVVGVGIGGSFENSSMLAKKSLLREIGIRNKNGFYALLESEICQRINSCKIGPLGLGGDTSCLDVFIETSPTHIATLPVSVMLQCHSYRKSSTYLTA